MEVLLYVPDHGLPSLISLMVSVDVKHDVYPLAYLHNPSPSFFPSSLISLVVSVEVKHHVCPPREHQGEGLHLVFQTFAENPFLYLGKIVNSIVYVRLRWCVC